MRLRAIAFATVLALTCGVPALAGAPRDARDVPLVDQNGVGFTLRDIHRPTAVIFVATRCGDACPIAEALFSRLSGELAREHVDARLLTVTLDPEHDAPIVMSKLGARVFVPTQRAGVGPAENRATCTACSTPSTWNGSTASFTVRSPTCSTRTASRRDW